MWKIWNTTTSTWDVVPSQAVVNNFTALGDTPATYTGQGGKVVKVKLNQSGLEFVDETTFFSEVSGADAKNTPLDADLFGLTDTTTKKVSWVNIKDTLKTYFDTIYVSVSTVTSQMIDNWNTAFGWGDHATQGYLTEEIDPVFGAHPASNVIDTGAGTNYLADDGTYKTIVVPDGSQWEADGTGFIRPKDAKEVKGDHIDIDPTLFDKNLDNTVDDVQKLAQAVDDLSTGHTIYSGSTELPQQDGLNFDQADFLVTDEVGQTKVKTIKWIKQLSFIGGQSTGRFKPAENITINSAEIDPNITDLRAGKNGATPATMAFPYSILDTDVIDFEITYTDGEKNSYVTFKGKTT